MKKNQNKKVIRFNELSTEDKKLVLNHFDDIEEYNSSINIIEEYKRTIEYEKETFVLDSSIEYTLQHAFSKKHHFLNRVNHFLINHYFTITSAAAALIIFFAIIFHKSYTQQSNNIASHKNKIIENKKLYVEEKALSKQNYTKNNIDTKQVVKKKNIFKSKNNKKAITQKLLMLNDPSICAECIKMDSKAMKKLSEIDRPGMNENIGSIRMTM